MTPPPAVQGVVSGDSPAPALTRADAAAQRPLSVTGEQLSQESAAPRARQARTARWSLRREGVWRVSQQPRLWKCGRYLHNEDGTNVKLKEGSAYYDGLVTCGSIWSCPVCAARIRQRRAGEIEKAVLAHLAAGGGVEFPTFTLPHKRGDALADSLRAVQKAWAATWRSSAVVAVLDSLGYSGRIRATEITRGEWHGWHPHAHGLLFLGRPISDEERALLLKALARAWAAAVVRQGFPRPSDDHGVTLRKVTTSDVGNYLAKIQDHYGQKSSVALEMARSDAKKGRKNSRTPFQILEGAAAGLARDVALWHEYEAATKGRRAIEWSRGLKARFGVDERDDEDLAAEDVDGEHIAWVPRPDWYALIAAKKETAVLDAAEDRGTNGVHDVLAELRGGEQDEWVE